jgi:hypothetical protein
MGLPSTLLIPLASLVNSMPPMLYVAITLAPVAEEVASALAVAVPVSA